jgi:hypothetical protein
VCRWMQEGRVGGRGGWVGRGHTQASVLQTGLAGALGRRGRGALKKSDPGGGAGRSKKVGGANLIG